MRLISEFMHRPAAPVRSAALERLTALEREIPEWQSWAAMLRVLAQAIGDPVWRDPVRDLTGVGGASPILDAQRLRLPEHAMSRLVQALLDIAQGTKARGDANALDADSLLPLVHASITGDSRTIDTTAQSLGMRTAVLATVLQAATLPLFSAGAAQLAHAIPSHWPHGFCPACGAWPVLAELLGLDRSRRLRCGRCGTGWDMPWLVCAFCQEADHAKLGTLVPASGAQGHKIETCGTCRGYLKTIAVLKPGSHLDLLLADLESVPLDVAAQGEGLVRPEGPGHPLTVSLVSEVSEQ